MLIYRLTSWLHPLPETWLPMLAQVETTVEKAYGAVMKGGSDFGNSTDAVKFGITLFVLVGVIGALAYLYVAGQRATIKKQDDRIIDLENEVKENRERYEAELKGMWGLMQKAVSEMSAQRAMVQDFGLAKIQRDIPEVAIPPPRSSFLPSGPRRVPRRKEGEE